MSDFEPNEPNDDEIISIPITTTTTPDEIILEKETFLKKDAHPCQYCGNSCYGKQCKQCHLKMLDSQKGVCMDCNVSFHAVRRDGSKRRRCTECQTAYNNKYISQCPDCNNTYHAYMEDGRVFEKCFGCYKKSLHKCTNCDNFTKFEYALCRNCYQTSDRGGGGGIGNGNGTNRRFHSSPRELQLFKCNNEICENLTSKNLCKSCYVGGGM
jgi:hypothetical protein